MFVIKFQKLHFVVTFGTLKGIVTKRQKKKLTPSVKIQKGAVLVLRDSPEEGFICFPVPCIEPVIACHLEIFFRDMLDEQGNKVQYRNSFLDV